MHTMKLRYSLIKVPFAQNIIGEVSLKVAKKGLLDWSATKNLPIFSQGQFYDIYEENMMDKAYTAISSELPCVVCLYFFKTLILTIFMNLWARDNRL